MREAVLLVPTAVRFPALCVPRDFGVYLVRDWHHLRRTRAQCFWRDHHFAGLRLYDTDGKALEVTAAAVSRPVSRLGRALARFLDLTITVDVELAPMGAASLPDVIAAVHRAMAADPEALEELSGRSLAWWQVTLAQASSVQEVIRAFDEPQHDDSPAGEREPHT